SILPIATLCPAEVAYLAAFSLAGPGVDAYPEGSTWDFPPRTPYAPCRRLCPVPAARPSRFQETAPMGKARGDFTDILVKKGILGADQLEEAKALQAQTGAKIQDALLKLGYATQDDIMAAVAEHSGMTSVTLTDVTIPPAIIEMVPESVARENVVIPLSQENGVLK